jgi:hypothetical protein
MTSLCPLVLLAILLLAPPYLAFAHIYRISARDLRRLDSGARSPILSHFGESLRGRSEYR